MTYQTSETLNYFSSFAADGLLYTAEELVPADVLADMVPTFIENSKYEGTAYAVPDLASARLFFYNKDILEQAGVTVEELATWDGLEAALKKIKAAVPDVVPLALPLGPEEAQAEFLIWLLLTTVEFTKMASGSLTQLRT